MRQQKNFPYTVAEITVGDDTWRTHVERGEDVRCELPVGHRLHLTLFTQRNCSINHGGKYVK